MLRHFCLSLASLLLLFNPVVYATNATPQENESSSVVIHRFQSGITGASNHEYIELYNNTSEDIDVSAWCLVYNDNLLKPVACIDSPDAHTKIYLSSYSSALFMNPTLEASEKQSFPEFKADKLFDNLTNLPNTSGTLKLINASGTTMDLLGWGVAIGEDAAAPGDIAGKVLQRRNLNVQELQDTNNNSADFEVIATLGTYGGGGLYEDFAPADICPNTPEFDHSVPIGFMQDDIGDCYEDVCDNLSGLQKNIPNGYLQQDIDCLLIPLQITELLPNANGADTGNEFIEIYNPGDTPIDLTDYYLQIGSGTKRYAFPAGTVLDSNAFLSFSDTVLKLTLRNSSSKVSLHTPIDELLYETSTYNNPGENQAWALIDGIWQYTDKPTPNSLNILFTETREVEDTTLAPCPAGKFRNPETNRCKNIADAASSLLPCAAGSVRNLETNRCRKLTTTLASSTLKPCKEGQERNPETNRCRKVASAANSLKPCEEGQERNPETNRCRKVTGTVAAGRTLDPPPQERGLHPLLLGFMSVLALAYAAYEYRLDFANWHARIKEKIAQDLPKNDLQKAE